MEASADMEHKRVRIGLPLLPIRPGRSLPVAIAITADVIRTRRIQSYQNHIKLLPRPVMPNHSFRQTRTR